MNRIILIIFNYCILFIGSLFAGLGLGLVIAAILSRKKQ